MPDINHPLSEHKLDKSMLFFLCARPWACLGGK
jgi:hypothetical protein